MAWHLVTCEYPPQVGGVSDYTRLVAMGLASAGDEVHVWCPPSNGAVSPDKTEGHDPSSVLVHREFGRFSIADLRRVDRLLNQFVSPRRLLVQWVPHGYGYQSMNLPFCLWLWQRAVRRRDAIELMVHEPYLPFRPGSWKQSGVAFVHRMMTMVLLNGARRVWMSIPAWEARWRPFALGRSLPFRWLPVASNIAVVDDPSAVKATRALYAPAGERVVGHFGTYDRNIAELLLQSLPSLLLACADRVVLLLGRGSEAMRDRLIGVAPQIGGRVHASGPLDAADLSIHIRACDVMLQPYIDGVSSRRTSLMVGLSHGMPIVTTSGTLTEPLWAESDAVALVPVNPAALVKTTERLLSDETSRLNLSAKAKILYDERFAVQRTIAALREAAG